MRKSHSQFKETINIDLIQTLSDKALKETAVNPALPSLHGGTFFRDVPLTTLISHLIQDFYYRQITWFILGIITFMIWRSSLESHPLWVTLQVEMGIVYVNKRNFWKRTKFFVSDGVVQKTSNDLDRSEKRKKAFFKNEREKT